MSKPSKLKRWLMIITLSGLSSAFFAERNIKITDDSLPPINIDNKDSWLLLANKTAPDFIKIYKKLKNKQVWGKEKKTTDKTIDEIPAKKTIKQASNSKRDWRLLGLLKQANIRYMLIKTKDNKVERYKMGDILPNGRIIIALDASTVVISNIDKTNTEKIALYKQ